MLLERKLILAITLVCSWFAGSPAAAQFFFFNDDRPRVRRAPPQASAPRRARRVAAAPAPAKTVRAPQPEPEQSSVPLFAVVSLEDQHVSIYGSDGLIERSDISSGTDANPTPTGIFAIIQKERWHESNIYSGAPMPFMQRLTWSGVAMHQGQLPGYAASHGCVRLPAAFAEQWYKMTKLGLRVLIAPTDVAPVAIAHPHLPEARFWPGGAIESAPIQSAGLSNEAFASLAIPRVTGLNPIAYAAAEKAKAKVDLKRAEQAENDTGDALESANFAVKNAASKLRAAERDATAARDRMAWFGLVDNRRPPPLRADFGDGIMVAIANFEAANTRLGEARLADEQAKAAAGAAGDAVKLADDRTEALKERIAEMTRRQEAVSIFVSRKDERLYVRQALRPVFDIPITIKNGDTPIGSHVFVAAAPAPGERALRWSAISMPVETQPAPRVARLKRGSNDETATIPAESAAGALDRIELPGEAMDQISEFVWAGASLIISDHGITHETGTGTDFIIQTRH